MTTTTLTAIASGRAALQFVMAMEGIPYLFTSGDPSAALLAWASTDWTQCLSGMAVSGRVDQRLKPWDPSVDSSPMTFVLQPDSTDAFAQLALGRTGVQTFLNAELTADTAAHSGTVTVLDTSQFASSGEIHVGTECMQYTSKTSTTFTLSKRGKYAPFNGGTDSGGKYARRHRIAAVGDGVTTKPKVTSKPREMRGRLVGMWAHRSDGGVLDVKAQAELVWAGVVREVRDGQDGLTYVDCDDCRALLRDATILNEQWTARVQEGIYLLEGMRLQALDSKGGTVKTANDLVVGATDSGTNQIAFGVYTLAKLITKLNAWLSAELAASRINLYWTLTDEVSTNLGIRSKIHFSGGNASGTQTTAALAGPPEVLDFLGWTRQGTGWTYQTNPAVRVPWDDGPTHDAFSLEEPYRIYVYDQGASLFVDASSTTGTWFDNASWFPAEMGLASGSTNYSVLQVNGGPMALFQQLSSTEYSMPLASPFLDQISGTPWASAGVDYRKVRVSNTGDFVVKQMGIFSGSFRAVINQLLYSTGSTFNYNESTYDTYPAQMGAAIPADLLSGWQAAVNAIDESAAEMLLVLTKPTKIMDALGADLVARVVALVWKSGSLSLSTWGTPTAALAAHTFTEDGKSAAFGTTDDHRTPTNLSEEFICNELKLEYNLLNATTQPSTLILRDAASQDENGQRPKTVSLRNTFSGVSATMTNVYDLANTLVQSLSLLSRPLRTLRRSISLPQFLGLAPGDFATISDNFARDPSTGLRGLSTKPCLVVGAWFDFGGRSADGSVRPMAGEVELVILPLDSISTYCPCAEVDYTAGGGGYSAGPPHVLTCFAHEHSLSSEAHDAARFAVNDKVKVLEVDPDDPAAAQSWTTTIDGISGPFNQLTLHDDLTGFSSAKRYRVISQNYGSATTSQQINVYQALSTTSRVASTVDAYAYGSGAQQGIGWDADGKADGTEAVALYSDDQHGDGYPLDTGSERDLARILNNLVSYRTAVCVAPMARTLITAPLGLGAYASTIIAVYPMGMQAGALGAGTRFLLVEPWFRSTDGTSVTLTVTLTRYPPAGNATITTTASQPQYTIFNPKVSISWTTSSTTYAAGTQEPFFQIGDYHTGECYLVVEASSHKLEFRGLTQCAQSKYTGGS